MHQLFLPLHPLEQPEVLDKNLPPKISTFPSKGKFTFIISSNVLFKDSSAHPFTIRASSQIIMVACLISSTKSDYLLIEQVDEALRIKGILNLECVVLPPGSHVAAMPDVDMAIAM